MAKETIAREFAAGEDSAGHDYVEVVCNKLGEMVRVTAIPETYGVTGAQPAIRIQIRDENGKLRPGPEFGSSYLPDVMWALVEVGRLLETKRRAPR
jgi:hypothetical protein